MKRLPLLVLLAGVIGCGALFNSKVKTISMTSTPTQAEVWIDGTMRGVTRLALPLDNQESHTVVFRKEGYQDVVCELSSELYESAAPSLKREMAATALRLAEGLPEADRVAFVSRVPNFDRALNSFSAEARINLDSQLSRAVSELALSHRYAL